MNKESNVEQGYGMVFKFSENKMHFGGAVYTLPNKIK